jgi:16S rRNA (cytosine1402-N4)-methyltransferase
MQTIPHIPVLYREVTAAFAECKGGIIVDCTMGYGGHSSLLLDADPSRRLIGIDQDETAIRFSAERLAPFGDRVEIRKGRFSKVLAEIVAEEGAENICGVLADIGFSSLQLDEKARGFSFESETLDMRMDPSAPLSAAEVVNTYGEAELERILREYGELPHAKKVARAIVAGRPFASAKALADAVRPFGPRGKKIHPATLVMQAIRIEVNDELGELRRLLDVCEQARFPDAVIGIISFHSLEDRIVKQRFAQWSRSCICPPEAMRCTCGNDHALGRPRPKKPMTAQPDELKNNPRSRSAKLRLFEMKCHER